MARRVKKKKLQPRVTTSGKPRCACGQCLSQLSSVMMKRWALHEGERWFRLSPRQAYFRHCAKCHKERWPQDVRAQNRHCRPDVVNWWRATGAVKTKLVCGDLWLLAPPPEEQAEAKQPARGQQQPRKRRRKGKQLAAESAERTEAEWQEQIAEAKRQIEAFKREPEPTTERVPEQEKAPATTETSQLRGVLRKAGARADKRLKQLTWKDEGLFERTTPPSRGRARKDPAWNRPAPTRKHVENLARTFGLVAYFGACPLLPWPF